MTDSLHTRLLEAMRREVVTNADWFLTDLAQVAVDEIVALAASGELAIAIAKEGK